MPPRVLRSILLQAGTGLFLLVEGGAIPLDELSILSQWVGLFIVVNAGVTAFLGPKLARVAAVAVRLVLLHLPFWWLMMGSFIQNDAIDHDVVTHPDFQLFMGMLLVPVAVTGLDVIVFFRRWRERRRLATAPESRLVAVGTTGGESLQDQVQDTGLDAGKRGSALAKLAHDADTRTQAIELGRGLLDSRDVELVIAVMEAIRGLPELSSDVLGLVRRSEKNMGHPDLAAHTLLTLAAYREVRGQPLALNSLEGPPAVQVSALKLLEAVAGTEAIKSIKALRNRTEEKGVVAACDQALTTIQQRGDSFVGRVSLNSLGEEEGSLSKAQEPGGITTTEG